MKNIDYRFIFTLFFLNSVLASNIPCKSEKDLPKLIAGCEGEACGFFHYNRVLKDVILYKSPDLKSKKIGLMKKCTEFLDIKPFMVMKSFGKANIVYPSLEVKNLGIKKGDSVSIYQDIGEGYLSLCIADKVNITGVMAKVEKGTEKLTSVSIIKNTTSDFWVKFILPDGRSGFSPHDYNSVMWYAMYDESKLCDPIHKMHIRHL